MTTALVAGSTGLIGEQLVQQLLSDDRYAKVIALVRQTTIINHPKLSQVVVNFDQLHTADLSADELFCCLGTTIGKAGSKAAFIKVDRDYIVNFAKLGKAIGAKKFALVSSLSANSNSKVFYSRVKGQTESAIIKLSYDTCYIVRPSLLLGDRKESRLGESFGKLMERIFRFAIPKKYKGIQGKQVAKAMIACMNQSLTGTHILESDKIAAF